MVVVAQLMEMSVSMSDEVLIRLSNSCHEIALLMERNLELLGSDSCR
jgi:hypothetical protein